MSSNENIYFASIVDTLQNHPLLKNVTDIISKKELSNYEDILKQASNIAAGQNDENLNSKFLASVFDGLTYDKDAKKNVWSDSKGFQYRLNTLSIDKEKDVFFPIKDTPQYEDVILLKDLKNDLSKVKDSPENIFHLLEKYTVNIPSRFGNNIAFYDYLKIKTAAAICLDQEHEASKEFLIVGLGISGIQSFLFDIVSKKASVNLKGRSFYLQLLPDLVIQRVLTDLKLYSPNVLYASGGNAYILAPNNKIVTDALEKIKEDVSNALFKAHGIGLYLEMAWKEAASFELTSSTNKVMKELNEIKTAQKRHKFSVHIAKCDDFFEPKEEGGEQLRDAVTGEELNEKNCSFDINENKPIKYFEAQKDANSQPIGELTKYIMTQGENLEEKENKYLVIKSYKSLLQPFAGIGFSYKIVKDTEGGKNFYLKEGLDYLPKPNEIKPNAVYGFSFYGGNDFAEIQLNNKNKPVVKTYSELAGQKETSKVKDKFGIEKLEREYYGEENPKHHFIEPSFKRLAVLRMDVDGLGSVFINGFPSLTTYSVLSRSLDYFFKGYLNTIWETGIFEAFDKKAEKEPLEFKKYIQIVYAGGDDLFAVGRWDAIIAFGKEVRERFKDWVCQNPNFGISAGISLVTPKFPIIKAAEYADKEEKKAKDYKFNNNGKVQPKNAISMMGVTMNWDYEFALANDLKDKIVDFISNKDENGNKKYYKELPNSFIFKINGFYEIIGNNKRKGIEDYRWVWQMAYDLTRMKERIYDKNKRDSDQSLMVVFLKELVNWTITKKTPSSVTTQNIDYFTFFKLLNLACIWASYELRNKEN